MHTCYLNYALFLVMATSIAPRCHNMKPDEKRKKKSDDHKVAPGIKLNMHKHTCCPSATGSALKLQEPKVKRKT